MLYLQIKGKESIKNHIFFPILHQKFNQNLHMINMVSLLNYQYYLKLLKEKQI